MTDGGTTGHTATASTHIAEPPERVWAELMHPGARWMLGANIETDFRPGSPVTFEGHFFGRQFTDKGRIIAVERPRLLHFTHFSPLGERPDVPESYHEIRITLEPDDGGTRVEVVQANIDTAEHAARSEQHWCQALATLAHRDTAPTAGS
ncbi:MULTISPECIES: SRPBCC family protein [unclassified Isoptericola]|uniref:SRPBCC family protein n=1 Tax=unclassified Isoptericola TaxID=2623355 RepID=UPI00271444B9|nr:MULTISPECIES: SRPBCC family protein [unclassified Isoptericola]MDO8143642.1 SRPBCC family protein [Isoptericola sp. 178]MDO8150160.1 SRPBCC family protein [Isoptericola sp. b408]